MRTKRLFAVAAAAFMLLAALAVMSVPSVKAADTLPPTIFNTSPALTTTVFAVNANFATVDFSAEFSDNVGVTSVIWYSDGVVVDSAAGTNLVAASEQIQLALQPAPHFILLTASDAAGNSAETGWAVTVTTDTTPPTITSPTKDITAYLLGGTAQVPISATITDNAGIAELSFQVDQGAPDVAPLSQLPTTYQLFDPLTFNGIGQHTVTLIATDASGNSATYIWTINVVADTIAPVVSGFTNGQMVKAVSGLPISASFSDAQSGVDGSSVKVLLNGQDVTHSQYMITLSSSGFQYATTGLAKGDNTFFVTVMDKAGNSAGATWIVKVTGGAVKK